MPPASGSACSSMNGRPRARSAARGRAGRAARCAPAPSPGSAGHGSLGRPQRLAIGERVTAQLRADRVRAAQVEEPRRLRADAQSRARRSRRRAVVVEHRVQRAHVPRRRRRGRPRQRRGDERVEPGGVELDGRGAEVGVGRVGQRAQELRRASRTGAGDGACAAAGAAAASSARTSARRITSSSPRRTARRRARGSPASRAATG